MFASKGSVMPPLWSALTPEETAEMQRMNHTVAQWVLYCEKCTKTKQPIDMSLRPTDDMYFRQAKLRDKMWGPLKSKDTTLSMPTSEKLAEMAAELARHAINDINEHWQLMCKSQACIMNPDKFSIENTIRYNIAKIVVEVYQKVKAEANG